MEVSQCFCASVYNLKNEDNNSTDLCRVGDDETVPVKISQIVENSRYSL